MNKRNAMEDFLINEELHIGNLEYTLVAVMDGHNGKEVSSFI